MIRRAAKTGSQIIILGTHPHRTSIGMTLTNHQTAQCQQRRGANTEFLGSQHRGNNDVSTSPDTPVSAQRYPLAEPVERKHLMGFCQAKLQRTTRELDRGQGCSTCSADRAGNIDDVSICLGHAGSDGANAGRGDQFHPDPRLRIDLFEVVDQLGQVFDGIDVMVRRRRDQRHTRRRQTHARDKIRNLETGQLAAFAGLGPLGDLDLDLPALVEIFRRDSKPA